jgi:elongation factor Ts
VGCWLEVNCETDFVARRDEDFKSLVRDIAMQIAACSQCGICARIGEIPADMMRKKKRLRWAVTTLASKPENIREKIVEGSHSKAPERTLFDGSALH